MGLLSLVSVLALSIPAQAHLGHEHQDIPIDAPMEAVQSGGGQPNPFNPSRSSNGAIAGQVQLQLAAQPPLSGIIPAQQPVRLKLEAVDRQKTPIQQAQWQITLNTPPTNPWLTTDFPIVEGTTLLNAELKSAEDTLELETILPIRGAYRLQATATAPGMDAPVTQTFVLNVPENPVKYRNAATLAVILLLLGLVGGWVIARQPQKREDSQELAQSVRLLLSGAAVAAIVALLAVNLSAEQAAQSHAERSLNQNLSRTTAEVGSLKLEYLGDTIATVGKLADLSARLMDTRTNQPIQDVTFQLKAKDAEHGATVLAIAGKPNASGIFTWQQQFFDGAPHQIQIEALSPTSSKPVTLTQAIEVEGIAPPMSVRLKTLGYMTAIVAIGMAIGFGAGRMKRGSRRFKGFLKPNPGRF